MSKLNFGDNRTIDFLISLNNKETCMEHLGYGNSWDNVEEYASMHPMAHDEETGRALDIECYETMSLEALVESQGRDDRSNVSGYVKEATDWHDEVSGERELGKAELCDWSGDGELTAYEADFYDQEMEDGPKFFSKEEFIIVQNRQRELNLSNYLAKVNNAKTNADLGKIAFELLGGSRNIKLPNGQYKKINVIGFCAKENPRGLFFFPAGGLTEFWDAYRAKKASIQKEIEAAADKIQDIFMEYIEFIASANAAWKLKKLNQEIYADNRLPYSAKTELWNTSKERIARMA